MGLDVFFFPGAFLEPDVDDGQLQGGIGIGQHRYPFISMDGGAVVQFGADIDLLDAGLRPEVADAGGVLPGEAPGGRLRVAAPEEHHIAVLGDIFNEVGGRGHHALEALAPDVLGAPVPAFPAIRASYLLGKAAHHIEEAALVAVGGMDGLAFAVAVALDEDGERAVGLVHPFYFIGDDGRGFVPGNSVVFALAAVLRDFVSPLGSQSTLMRGYLIRLEEKVLFL